MIESKILISAIITTHNRLHLLKRAVKSVREQTYAPMELIVVDDASDDGETESWCRRQEALQEQPEQPFRYIRIVKEESRGGNHARNLGIIAAKGEYVAFLDDDDAWLPDKTSKQMALMLEKNCELVYGGRMLEIVKGEEISYRESNPCLDGDLSKKILSAICATTTTIIARKQALVEVGSFDENLGFWQEYELTIRMAQRTPFYYVGEPLALYRIDESDRARLTNKFDGWKNAVKYIYEKHSSLYARLSARERFEVKCLYWCDAAGRAKASGKKLAILKFSLLVGLLGRPYRALCILETAGFKALMARICQKYTGDKK